MKKSGVFFFLAILSLIGIWLYFTIKDEIELVIDVFENTKDNRGYEFIAQEVYAELAGST